MACLPMELQKLFMASQALCLWKTSRFPLMGNIPSVSLSPKRDFRCSQVDDDEDCLKSIYQVYSKMTKLQRIEFDFERYFF